MGNTKSGPDKTPTYKIVADWILAILGIIGVVCLIAFVIMTRTSVFNSSQLLQSGSPELIEITEHKTMEAGSELLVPETGQPGSYKVPVFEFVGDGSRFITGDENGVVRLRDTRTGRLLRSVSRSSEEVTELYTAPSGNWSAARFSSKAVLFRSSDLQPMKFLRDDDLSALTFTKNGSRLATGNSKGEIRVYNVETGSCTNRMDVEKEILALAYQPNASRLVGLAGNNELTVMVWNASSHLEREKTFSTGWQLGSNPNLRSTNVFLHVRQNGTHIVTAAAGRGLKVYDRSKEKTVVSVPLEDEIVDLKLDRQANRLYITYREAVHIRSIPDGSLVERKRLDVKLTNASFHPPSNRLIGATREDRNIFNVDLTSGMSELLVSFPLMDVTDVETGFDEPRLAVTDARKNSIVWRAKDGITHQFKVNESEEAVVDMSLGKKGRHLIQLVSSGMIQGWDLITGNQVMSKSLEHMDISIYSGKCDLSPTRDRLAINGEENLYMYSYPDGKEIGFVELDSINVDDLEFTTDGESLLVMDSYSVNIFETSDLSKQMDFNDFELAFDRKFILNGNGLYLLKRIHQNEDVSRKPERNGVQREGYPRWSERFLEPNAVQVRPLNSSKNGRLTVSCLQDELTLYDILERSKQSPLLVVRTLDGALEFHHVQTGTYLGSLYLYRSGNWLFQDSKGNIDGSPNAFTQVTRVQRTPTGLRLKDKQGGRDDLRTKNLVEKQFTK